MTHEISTFMNILNVTGKHPYLDEAARRLRGTWNREANRYAFDTADETEIRELVDRIHAGYARRAANTPTAAPAPAASTTNPTGWSKAARRRAGRGRRTDHPFGRVTHVGDGYTEYEDEAFGGGRVQIWDNS